MPNNDVKDYVKVIDEIRNGDKLSSSISTLSSLKSQTNVLIEKFNSLKRELIDRNKQLEEAKAINIEDVKLEKQIEIPQNLESKSQEQISVEPSLDVEKPEKVKIEPVKEDKPLDNTKEQEINKEKVEKTEPPKQKIEYTDNPNIIIVNGVKTWIGEVKQNNPKPNKPQKNSDGIKIGKDVFVPINQGKKVQGQNIGQRPTNNSFNNNGRQPRQQTSTTSIPSNIPQPLPQKGKNNKGINVKPDKKTYEEVENAALNKKTKNTGVTIIQQYDEYGNEYEIIKSKKNKGNKSFEKTQSIEITSATITTDPVSIKTLSEKIGKTASQIVATLFKLDIFKNINDSIDFATAELVAGEYNISLEYKPEITQEDILSNQLENEEIDDLDKLSPRAPVITIMGHVDHGKSSLLEYIRDNYLKTKSHITSSEAGGITQKIGAYTISIKGQKITFLDTPGHEAFTSMRLRGAMVADIAILVVAADDGIMPQTIESISHVKQANIPLIVAVNKMDKPTANPDLILNQLTQHDITPEDWGGDTPVVKVSAKTGLGIEELLEQILVRAEVQELKANPDRKAKGTIIEARLDKEVGKIATVLVQNGTLNIGDYVVAGTSTGRIRSMKDDLGKACKKAGPSTAVSVTGWDDIPSAGDNLVVVDNAKFAKDLALERQLKIEAAKNVTTSVSLNDLFAKAAIGELKSVKLLIKADDQGSVEAVKQLLAKLGNEEVTIDIIHSAVGGINESDVQLAQSAGAIIIGFNVRPDGKAKILASQEKIDIRFYNVIYDIKDDIENAVKGLLAPKFQDIDLGSAEVRETFKISGVGLIAGCRVIEGKITRDAKARIIRDGKVLFTGEIASLKHGKDDAKEMKEGFECGISITNYQDIKIGDVIEAFSTEQVKNED